MSASKKKRFLWFVGILAQKANDWSLGQPRSLLDPQEAASLSPAPVASASEFQVFKPGLRLREQLL
jgi:hypothetical protein